MTKQSPIGFYTHLENQFPKIKDFELFKEINIEEDSWENSGLITSLAKVLINFIPKKKEKLIQFMKIVEDAFENTNETVTSYLYIDFLVSLMEQKKGSRDFFKSIMGNKTKNNYKKRLGFYRELDK